MVLFGTCIIESLAACLKASQFLLHHPDVTGFYTSNKIIGGKKTDQRCLVIGVRKKKKESELEEQWILPKVIEHGGYRHLVLGWCGGARNALPGQSESVHAHWPGTWTSRADRVRGRHLKGHRLLASRVPRTFRASARESGNKSYIPINRAHGRSSTFVHPPVICNQRLQLNCTIHSSN